jgi:hypothetical protein
LILCFVSVIKRDNMHLVKQPNCPHEERVAADSCYAMKWTC